MSSRAGGTRGFRVAGATAMAIALAGPGCGGDGNVASGTKQIASSTTPPSSTEVPTSTITTSLETTTTTPGATDSGLLGRRDVPPADVGAQFAARAGAGPGPCFFDNEPAPEAFVPQPEMLGAGGEFHAELCFVGFAPNRAVDARISFPDGTTKTFVVRARPETAALSAEELANGGYPPPWLDWYLQPGDPVGEYEVTATQGGSSITGGFTVVPIDREVIFILPEGLQLPATGPPGTSFTVGLLGFRPNAPVTFHIYGVEQGGSTFRFLTSVSTQVDDAGERRFNLTTSTSDPPGTYCVILPEEASSLEPGGFSRSCTQGDRVPLGVFTLTS